MSYVYSRENIKQFSATVNLSDRTKLVAAEALAHSNMANQAKYLTDKFNMPNSSYTKDDLSVICVALKDYAGYLKSAKPEDYKLKLAEVNVVLDEIKPYRKWLPKVAAAAIVIATAIIMAVLLNKKSKEIKNLETDINDYAEDNLNLSNELHSARSDLGKYSKRIQDLQYEIISDAQDAESNIAQAYHHGKADAETQYKKLYEDAIKSLDKQIEKNKKLRKDNKILNVLTLANEGLIQDNAELREHNDFLQKQNKLFKSLRTK